MNKTLYIRQHSSEGPEKLAKKVASAVEKINDRGYEVVSITPLLDYYDSGEYALSFTHGVILLARKV